MLRHVRQKSQAKSFISSEFSPTTNPGLLRTRGTPPSSHPLHMSLCLACPSHVHSHAAVPLSVRQPRFQSVFPVNDKTFGKSISFFLNQSPAQMQVRMPVCQTPQSQQMGRMDSFGASATLRGFTVERPPAGTGRLPRHHCLATSSSPQSSSGASASQGSQATLTTQPAEKQHSKTKPKHCSRLVVLKLPGLKSPLHI